MVQDRVLGVLPQQIGHCPRVTRPEWAYDRCIVSIGAGIGVFDGERNSAPRMTVSGNAREGHLQIFYALMDQLSIVVGGPRTLACSHGRSGWPKRGVYFFFEPGEMRSDSGSGMRVVRVGTHALKSGAGTNLWTRLRQHRGSARSGGGNHRGSIFRSIVGASLIERKGYRYPTWGEGDHAPPAVRGEEIALEAEVSRIIGAMPFLWLAVDDEPGPGSERGAIERNAIALLSNYSREPLDPSSSTWLGHACDREKVRGSGLWNSDHVDMAYDPAFLDVMKTKVASMRSDP